MDLIREPGTGKGDDATAPKGTTPPQLPGRDTLPATVAEQGRPLPIVYGTCKVPLQLIEKFAPTAGNYPGWTNSTSYVIGQRVTNRGHVYEALNAGISGTTGGPTGTDASISDGTVTWKHLQKLPMPVYSQYFAAALCEGEVVGAVSMWWDKEKITAQTAELPGKHLTLLRGRDAVAQTVPPSFDQSGYQRTAVLLTWAAAQTYTGTQKELPEIALELRGVMFGLASGDVNPADIIADLLTHSRRGLGLRSTIVGDSISGAGATSYRTYCDALGLRLSMLLDTQRNVLEIIAALLLATNTEACYSGDELKCVPLGDQATTAPVYGSTNFVPDTTAVYNLGLDDFLDRDAPVQIRRRSDADCFNSFPVEYTDRAQGYARVTAEDPDLLDIEDRGLRRGETIALPVTFPNGERPIMLSRIAAQRSSSPDCRNEYTFRLPWRYVLLEPLDVVTLTEPKLGLALKPVRIRSISEEGESLTVIADDFPAGVAAAASYVPQASDGYTPQERLTTQEIPSSVDQQAMGLADGIVGPAAINQAVDSGSSLVPNGNFEIWTPPATRSTAPPDGWRTIRSDGVLGFVADPGVWQSQVEPDGSESQSGDYSLWIRQPENSTAYGVEPSQMFPVTGGEAYTIALAYMYEDVLAQVALKTDMAYYDAGGNHLVTYGTTVDYSVKGVWRRAVHLARAPAAARWARFRLYTTHDGPVPAGTGSVWVDSVSVMKAPTRFLATTATPVSVPPGAWVDASLDTSASAANPAGDYILPPQATPYYFKVASTDNGQQFAFRGSLGFTSVPVGACIGAAIYKNGALLYQGPLTQVAVPGAQGVSLATVNTPPVELATGDQIRLYVWQNDVVARAFLADARYTWFAGERIR